MFRCYIRLADAQEPYSTKDKTQLKRYNAQSMGTTYAYDLCDLFREAIAQRWGAVHAASRGEVDTPDLPASVVELVLDDAADGGLREEKRAPGLNKLAMLAWRMVLSTPEYPEVLLPPAVQIHN